GLVTQPPFGLAMDAEIAAAVETAGRFWEKAGHTVIAVAFPEEPSLSTEAEKIWYTEIAMLLKRREREVGRQPNGDEIEALTAHALAQSLRLGAIAYLEARQRLHEISIRTLHSLADFDLLLTPTTALLAPCIGSFDTRTSNFDYARNAKMSAAFAPFTELFS